MSKQPTDVFYTKDIMGCYHNTEGTTRQLPTVVKFTASIVTNTSVAVLLTSPCIKIYLRVLVMSIKIYKMLLR